MEVIWSLAGVDGIPANIAETVQVTRTLSPDCQFTSTPL
jgi:hypothetical protein